MIWSNPFDNAISVALSEMFEGMGKTFQNIFISFSSFGNKGIFFILVGIFLLFFIKTRKIGITLLLGVFFTLVVNDLILKNIFDRARPYMDPELAPLLPSLIDGKTPVGIVPGSSSFPSGHTFTAFYVFGGLLSLYIFDKEERKNYLLPVIFFGIFALVMGFSRILLSHHYFTDVLAGALIGCGIGFSAYILIKYLYKLFDIIKTKFLKTKDE